MAEINPFTGSILQAPFVQRQQAVERDRQLRRAEEVKRNVAHQDDFFDSPVENPEAVQPAGDQRPKEQRRQQHSRDHEALEASPQAPGGHIDLTA